jgi:hypothetical protein
VPDKQELTEAAALELSIGCLRQKFKPNYKVTNQRYVCPASSKAGREEKFGRAGMRTSRSREL